MRKKIVLFLFLCLLTSCVIDRIPRVEIKIDKNVIDKIDSIELITDNYYTGVQKDVCKVFVDKQEYMFPNNENTGTIRLIMKTKPDIVFSQIQLKNSDWLIVCQTNNRFKIEPHVNIANY